MLWLYSEAGGPCPSYLLIALCHDLVCTQCWVWTNLLEKLMLSFFSLQWTGNHGHVAIGSFTSKLNWYFQSAGFWNFSLLWHVSFGNQISLKQVDFQLVYLILEKQTYLHSEWLKLQNTQLQSLPCVTGSLTWLLELGTRNILEKAW
jgi:hypothetical protein